MKIVRNIERYGLAAIVCALAVALAWWSDAIASCLLVAVMVSGLYAGRGPGLFSVGLSAIAYRIFLSERPFPLRTAPLHDFRFAAFLATALVIHQLIAAKKRADDARRQSDEYGRIVAETTTDAMLVIDEKQRIVFANGASTKLFGRSVEDLRGRLLSTLIDPSPGDGNSRSLEQGVGRRRDGSEFSAEISFAAVLRDGQRHFAGFVRDVSELKRSQAILKKSESYLAMAQKLSHTGSFGLNLASGELFWSEEAYHIGGFELGSQPAQERVWERLHPDDLQRVRKIFDEAVQRGSDMDFEHRFLFPDGSVKYVHVVAKAAPNPLGQVEYVGSMTDITTIRRAEDELRRSEQRYRDLIELSPDAIIVVDEAGLLVSTNRAGLEMLGCTEEEARGLQLAETHMPEDRPDYFERLQQLKHGHSFHFERTFLRRDGTTLPVEVLVAPVHNGQSQAVLRDIRERKQAQEALQRSEFYLSEAEKLSHAGSWAFDAVRQKIVYWSAEHFRLNHHDPSQPLPTLEQEKMKYSPEDWARFQEAVEKTIREKTDFDLELAWTNPDGSSQHIRMVGHPLLNAAGEVTEIIGTTIDITEQFLSRAALREALERVQRSEDQLRLITDSIPAQTWRAAPDGSLEFVNRRWTDYTGMTIDEARGWAWKSLIHADDIEHLLEAWGLALARGEASEVEGRVRRFDGAYRWFLFRAVPLRDEAGTIVHWFGTNTDIEDRKQAEQALLASEHQLNLIIDTIPALVWCALPDGKLEYVNQRIVDYLGVPVSELVQHGWTNFLHPDDVEPTLRSWFHAVATGTRHEVEYRMRCADGSYRWFHVLGQPLRDEAGSIVRWYGLLADIEERKNAVEALRSTQARLSRAMQIAAIAEFAAAIAHEVNQPLAAVVANAHACQRWLSAAPPNLAEASLAAERLIRDGNNAAEVVRRIRALFKQAAPKMVALDLNDVLTEVIGLLHGETLRQGVIVETELEAALPPVMADRLQLQQVLFNLLQNGIEAMEPLREQPKKLVVRSRRQGSDTLLAEIRDYGCGLSDLDKPFEAFYTTKERGMGMGLAICRSIIDAHHGRLWAAPTEGSGATFCLTLPLNGGQPAVTTAALRSAAERDPD